MFGRFARRFLTIGAVLGLAAPARSQDTTRALTVTMRGFVLVTYRSGDPLIVDGFRLRKADIKFSGDISPKMRWRTSFDAAKMLTLHRSLTEIDDSVALNDVTIDQRSRILQDAALTYAVSRTFALDIGQQIIPEGLEGTYPTAQIETIERTLFVAERSRAVGLGDVRDVGVSANGNAADGQVEYHVGVFNEAGDGAGTLDVNPQKMVIGRVALHPDATPGFQFGGTAGYQGGAESARRERVAGEAQFRNHDVTVRAEVMSARDGLLRRLGWYGLGAYRPTARLQLAGRYDWWDRDRGAETGLANALETQVVVGASYFVDGTVGKLALNVVRQTFPRVETVRSGTILLLGFSAVW